MLGSQGAFLTLLLVALSACAPAQLVRQSWTPQGGPENALLLAQSGLSAFDDLTAEARITFRQGRSRRTATASILYLKPDLFRVDVRGPLYSHLLSLLLRDSHVTALAGKETWQGEDTGGLLSSLTPFELGDYDLRYALLGLVWPGADDAAAGREGPALGISNISYPRADRAIVQLVGGQGERLVWIDLQTGFVLREQLRSRGRTVWTRELGGYVELQTASGPVYLPENIRFEQGDVGIELEYKYYRVDEGLSAKILEAGIPEPWQ